MPLKKIVRKLKSKFKRKSRHTLKVLRKSKNGITVVFIHGLNSSRECWRHKNGSYWPKLLHNDKRFAEFGISTFDYQTGILAGDFSIKDIVDNLHASFSGIDHNLFDSPVIIFVAHSMGGIIARRFLVQHQRTIFDDKSQTYGLFLIGSPSFGSLYAHILQFVLVLFRYSQATILSSSSGNTFLTSLNDDFDALLKRYKNKIVGKALIEDHSIFLYPFDKMLGIPQIVKANSASAFFRDKSLTISGSTHFTIATPENKQARQHEELLKFINDDEFLYSSLTRPSSATVEAFLQAIADDAAKIELFHTRQRLVLPDLYIDVRVTSEFDIEQYSEKSQNNNQAYADKSLDDKGGSDTTQVAHRYQEWGKVSQDNKILAILADPGMGKSTLLRQESYTIACSELKKLKNEEKTTEEIIFPLRFRFSELAKKNTSSLSEIILELVKDRYPKVEEVLLTLLKHKLEEGQCLLLLDALDEVTNEERPKLKEKLAVFVRDSRCRIFYTSRILGYDSSFLIDAVKIKLVPFTELQIKDYVTNWFSHVAPVKTADDPTAEKLIRELNLESEIQGLAQNPLMLSLICSLYQQPQFDLPTQRTQLYRKVLDCMLNEWNQERSSSQEQPIFKEKLLAELAFRFSCKNKKEFDQWELHDLIEKYLKKNYPSDLQSAKADKLIKELSERDGILQKPSPNGKQYLFLHPTLQEYLTAVYLDKAANRIALLEKENLIWKFDWHETIILMAGLLEKPVPLLEMLTKGKDDIFKSQLLLAGRCLAECGELIDPVANDIVDRIYEFWQDYPEIPFLQSVVAELGRTQMTMLERFRTALYSPKTDPPPESKLSKLFHNPDSPASLVHTLQMLGRIGNTSVVPDIITTCVETRRGNWRVVADALLSIGGEAGLHPLLSMYNGDNKVGNRRRRAWREISLEHLKSVILDRSITRNPETQHSPRIEGTRILGYRGDPGAFEILSQILQNPTDDAEVRSSAALALGSLGDPRGWEILVSALEYTAVAENVAKIVDEITQLRSNELNPSVTENAAKAIEDMGHPSTELSVLHVALQDQRTSIVKATIKTLVKLGDLTSVEALMVLVVDEDRLVELRAQSINAISSILGQQDPASLDDLDKLAETSVAIITDQNSPIDVKLGAFSILRILPKRLSFDLVYEFFLFLQNRQKSSFNAYSESEYGVFSALIDIDVDRAVQLMAEMLKQDDAALGHSYIIAELCSIPTLQALEILYGILDGDNQTLRSCFIWQQLPDNPTFLKKLATFYTDQDPGIRQAAINALLKLEPLQTCDTLVEILQDPHQDQHTRARVAEALGKIDSEKAVQALLATLDDPQPKLACKVAAALAEHGRTEAIDVLAQDFFTLRISSLAVRSLEKLNPTDVLPTLFKMARCVDHSWHREVLTTLETMGSPKAVLDFLIQDPEIDLFKPEIFAMARRLAIRCAKENLSFIPVYPEQVNRTIHQS